MGWVVEVLVVVWEQADSPYLAAVVLPVVPQAERVCLCLISKFQLEDQSLVSSVGEVHPTAPCSQEEVQWRGEV
jgi:hypothetical protein